MSISLFRLTEKLVGLKASNGIKNRHFWIILAMAAIYIVCIYIIIPVFYDLYVIFLFPPLLYAALTYRFKGALLGSLIFVAILVPKTLPLSTEIPEMVRSFVFLVFPFLLSGFVAAWLHYFDGKQRPTRKYWRLIITPTLHGQPGKDPQATRSVRKAARLGTAFGRHSSRNQ